MDELTDDQRAGSADKTAQMIGLLCHELRQPLAVAVGYVSMLGDGSFGAMPAEAQAALLTIAERLDTINRIIDRLADRTTEALEPS